MQGKKERTDEEIAFSVQSGRTELFGALVERYKDKISRYGKKFLSDREDIQDILQEIFIKAYVNIRSFDANRKFSPWLYRIAHNEFINHLKKKKTLPLFDLDVFFPHFVEQAKNPLEEKEAKEIKEMVGDSLEKLLPKYREPIILYYLEGLDYKEIAEVLRVPISTVGVRLKRAKQKMKKYIKKNHYGK